MDTSTIEAGTGVAAFIGTQIAKTYGGTAAGQAAASFLFGEATTTTSMVDLAATSMGSDSIDFDSISDKLSPHVKSIESDPIESESAC